MFTLVWHCSKAVSHYGPRQSFTLAKSTAMDKLQVTGQNLGRVFNSRSGCMCARLLRCHETKLPDLKLKTRSKIILDYLLINIAHPDTAWLFATVVAKDELTLATLMIEHLIGSIMFCPRSQGKWALGHLGQQQCCYHTQCK
jgi:hypothetical protein